MVLAAVIAVATAAAPAMPAAPRKQAVATVRIVRAEPLRFAEIERKSPNALRTTRIAGPNGTREPARLLEFQ